MQFNGRYGRHEAFFSEDVNELLFLMVKYKGNLDVVADLKKVLHRICSVQVLGSGNRALGFYGSPGGGFPSLKEMPFWLTDYDGNFVVPEGERMRGEFRSNYAGYGGFIEGNVDEDFNASQTTYDEAGGWVLVFFNKPTESDIKEAVPQVDYFVGTVRKIDVKCNSRDATRKIETKNYWILAGVSGV